LHYSKPRDGTYLELPTIRQCCDHCKDNKRSRDSKAAKLRQVKNQNKNQASNVAAAIAAQAEVSLVPAAQEEAAESAYEASRLATKEAVKTEAARAASQLEMRHLTAMFPNAADSAATKISKPLQG
jgi:glutaredoxin